jgi:predicted DNA-binding WGR domain protein
MLLRFKAQSPERNVARFYTLRKHTNLWGDIVVSSSFGRIGTHGNVKHQYFSDTAQADSYINTVIRKRLAARTRIGCNYQVCSSI